MYQRAEQMSPKTHLIVQGSTWAVLAIIGIIRIGPALGDEVYPACPFVLDSIFRSDGYPISFVGFAAVVAAVGFGWFWTGMLMLAYRRWPKAFLALRVAAAKNGAPVALRAGVVTTAAGTLMLIAAQLTC